MRDSLGKQLMDFIDEQGLQYVDWPGSPQAWIPGAEAKINEWLEKYTKKKPIQGHMASWAKGGSGYYPDDV